MISSNQLKYYSSLLYKKYRNEENKFIIEGKKIILEGINSSFKCEVILTTNRFIENNRDFFNKIDSGSNRVEVIKDSDLKKISDTVNPQGITAVFLKGDRKSANVSFESNSIVYLDNISEPGNLGTIIRNCDWFGIPEIILSPDCAELFSPKTIRASMGSLFHLNIIENTSLKSLYKRIKEKGYKVLCADTKGINIFKFNASSKIIVIFSNEAKGPSDEILKLSDEIITVPKIGGAESLNVASASAIILAKLTN